MHPSPISRPPPSRYGQRACTAGVALEILHGRCCHQQCPLGNLSHLIIEHKPTTVQVMLQPIWQQRQQQHQLQLQPPTEEEGQQQPRRSTDLQAADGSKRGGPAPERPRPLKRPRVDSPEHQASSTALIATRHTPRLGLELTCDSAEDAAAAEQLLQHAYCLPLPACPVLLVRVLLLANKYQVELGELVDSLWKAKYDMEALKLMEEAAQLEVPKDIKRLLQVCVLSAGNIRGTSFLVLCQVLFAGCLCVYLCAVHLCLTGYLLFVLVIPLLPVEWTTSGLAI
jgi:hypothetical protein